MARAMTGWVRMVGDASSVEDGASEHEVGSERILLVRDGGRLFACQATCPHKFADLVEGPVVGATLTCAQHEATFDLATGRPEPGCEWAGTLEVYPVRLRDGAVEVQITSC